MALSNAEKQAAFKERMRAKDYQQMTVWVKKDKSRGYASTLTS